MMKPKKYVTDASKNRLNRFACCLARDTSFMVVVRRFQPCSSNPIGSKDLQPRRCRHGSCSQEATLSAVASDSKTTKSRKTPNSASSALGCKSLI
jgi:hypothetical protein